MSKEEADQIIQDVKKDVVNLYSKGDKRDTKINIILGGSIAASVFVGSILMQLSDKMDEIRFVRDKVIQIEESQKNSEKRLDEIWTMVQKK